MDLTDDEKLILELWPMYEDGSRVMPGDRAISNVGARKGEEFEVLSVRVNTIGVALTNLDGAFWIKKPGERVKRPDQEVLDADGVPIHVGDRVCYKRESSHEAKKVAKVEPYGHRDFVGQASVEPSIVYEDGGWDYATSVLHAEPEARDADGVPFHAGDSVWHFETAKGPFKVSRISYGDVVVEESSRVTRTYSPSILTHKRPALDADGDPIRVGDVVWHKSGWVHGIVESVDSRSLMNTVHYRSEDRTEYRDAAKDLTHRRPVLDAYGCPIKVGETVFNVITGAKLLVESVGPMFVDVRNGGLSGGLEPNLITHSPLWVRRVESGEVAIPMANGERHVVLSVDAEPSQDVPDGGAQGAAERSDGDAADSWGQIIDDERMDVCDYFHPEIRDCDVCRAANNDMGCEDQRTMELQACVKKLVETGGLQ